MTFEERQDLLGHKSGRIMMHYSGAELTRLIEAAESVCERAGNRLELVVLAAEFQLTQSRVPQKSRA